jgi:hypothetical protein
MSDGEEDVNLAGDVAAAAANAEKAALELLKLLETRRLLGDPRVRVQVPTETEAQDQPGFSMSRRYSIL